MTAELCPALPLGEWKDTYATLHMWTQIVGKIRLVQSPMVNHWWHSTLYVTSHGLGTSPIPYRNRIFEIDFNFTDHKLVIHTSDGVTRALLLAPRSVADFYGELTAILRSLAIEIEIHSKPDEVPNPIPFAKDHEHASYDAEYANRFWRILAQADRVLKEFRSRFIGKCSPVHFFWGSFDLAVTRFSGRPAPGYPGGVPNLPDSVTREAYSHEVSSCGFWPGGGAIIEPAFYSYAYPEPRGFKDYPVQPKAAFYSPDMGEFILPYNAVRQADNPDEVLLEFLQSTYEATANSGNWDRAALERTAVGQKQK